MFGMLMGTLARFQNEESRADMAVSDVMGGYVILFLRLRNGGGGATRPLSIAEGV